MTNEEAKFILNAYRPGGQDGGDPVLAEAIRQAQNDPALQTWWARTQTFDGTVTARLREVAPPRGLREAILTGARLSRPEQPDRRTFGWMALAASIALVIGIGGAAYYRARAATPGLPAFAQFALADARQGGHIGDPDAALDARLESSAVAVDRDTLPLDLAQMRSAGCRTLSFGGRKVFEVCFARGGAEYHLYVLPRSESSAPRPFDRAEVAEKDGAAAAWSDAHFVYALATRAGAAMLQRVL